MIKTSIYLVILVIILVIIGTIFYFYGRPLEYPPETSARMFTRPIGQMCINDNISSMYSAEERIDIIRENIKKASEYKIEIKIFQKIDDKSKIAIIAYHQGVIVNNIYIDRSTNSYENNKSINDYEIVSDTSDVNLRDVIAKD